MKITYSIYFVVIAVLLAIYTIMFVHMDHYFLINAGWNTSLIEAKFLCSLIAGLGFCLAAFYALFSKQVYSRSLISTHIVLYVLLCLLMICWDNNTFSLKEAVDSQGYKSIQEIKGEYGNTMQKDEVYRISFWILLIAQTIGLLNLLLGFFKHNKV